MAERTITHPTMGTTAPIAWTVATNACGSTLVNIAMEVGDKHAEQRASGEWDECPTSRAQRIQKQKAYNLRRVLRACNL